MNGYCPDDDPILCCGTLWCAVCRAESYATDAEWIGDDLIIATFPAVCRHYGEFTIVVMPSQLPSHRDRCAGYTMAGTWCRNRARPGSDYCWQHAGQEAR